LPVRATGTLRASSFFSLLALQTARLIKSALKRPTKLSAARPKTQEAPR
jgi:hypothetical protein